MLQAARELYAGARDAKRAEARKRREAKVRMEELRRFCAAHDIAFELITRKDGDNSHGPIKEERPGT